VHCPMSLLNLYVILVGLFGICVLWCFLGSVVCALVSISIVCLFVAWLGYFGCTIARSGQKLFIDLG